MGAILVVLRLIWRGRRLLLNQLLKPGYPLADHVCQFSQRLDFLSVPRGVRRGKYSQNFADRLRIMGIIVLIPCDNIAVVGADIRPPCLLRRPLYVCQDYNACTETYTQL